MTLSLNRALAVGLVLAASCTVPRPAAAVDPPASCESVVSAIKVAGQSHDLAGLELLYRRVQDPALNCSSKTISCSGRAIARAFATEAERLGENGAAPGDQKALLMRGGGIAKPWQVLAGLGEVELAEARSAHDPKLYEPTSRDLQEAMNAAVEDQPCQGDAVATTDELEKLKLKASEAGLLSAHFVATPTTRGESCGGIFLSDERGLIGTTPTPVPIRFSYNAATLTEDGSRAAMAMRDCIMEKHYRGIELSGHTDRVGSDAFNMNLSARRLDAVRDFLKKGGFAGEIVLTPKGKHEPFQADDPGRYTQAETDQMDRRVEIRKVEP